mmetsp:Transcript_2640/g.5826  ORF Transcript_2640/g.5826 Transcript_2640/m.5826 type:complete len:249 (-) Transcript_2640:212-958(-)
MQHRICKAAGDASCSQNRGSSAIQSREATRGSLGNPHAPSLALVEGCQALTEFGQSASVGFPISRAGTAIWLLHDSRCLASIAELQCGAKGDWLDVCSPRPEPRHQHADRIICCRPLHGRPTGTGAASWTAVLCLIRRDGLLNQPGALPDGDGAPRFLCRLHCARTGCLSCRSDPSGLARTGFITRAFRWKHHWLDGPCSIRFSGRHDNLPHSHAAHIRLDGIVPRLVSIGSQPRRPCAKCSFKSWCP